MLLPETSRLEIDGSTFLIIPGDHSADTSSVSATSDHAEVADLEGDDVLHLVGGQVQLDAVVHLGKRKRGLGSERKGDDILYALN